jgi:hypothetical protein
MDELPVTGVSVMALTGRERPGVVALEDARRACPDFVFLRTTRSSLDGLLAQYDLDPLSRAAPEVVEWLRTSRHVLLIRNPAARGTAPTFLTAYDDAMRLRLELDLGQPAGVPVAYVEWLGHELLAGGLRCLRVDGAEVAPVPLPPVLS